MSEFEVIFYELSNGECPAEKFVGDLPAKMKAKMIGLLEILEENSKKRLEKNFYWQSEEGRTFWKGWMCDENIKTIQRRTTAKS